MGELGESPKPLGGDKEIKAKAIERHYEIVTRPGVSDKEHARSLHALRILGRDRGKGIIINSADTLRRILEEERKNV